MIPLNGYPKEELEYLLFSVKSDLYAFEARGNYKAVNIYRIWHDRLYEAISDQEFKEKELPFKTEDNDSREFEL
jgi:hypothetical protein